MSTTLENVDFGKTAADYLTHRAGFPESLFRHLAHRGIGSPGSKVLDLGTGTGTLGRGFARTGCQVTAVDIAPELLDAARLLDTREGFNTTYQVASAEANGQAPDSFDVVTAGQCWHWFDAEAAAREVYRVLKPGGQVVIAHYDWLPLNGNVVRLTEQLIERHNPRWQMGNGHGIHPRALRDLGEAGFTGIESFSYDEPATYTHVGWRGRIRASAGVAATLSAAQVNVFDQALSELLARRFPQEPMEIPHRVFVIIGRKD